MTLQLSITKAVSLVALSVIMTGCSGVDMCEEPEIYEMAEGGKRIDAPDDLDELAAHKELVIPEASPRPPRDRNAGCLDRPPTLRVGDEEDAE